MKVPILIHHADGKDFKAKLETNTETFEEFKSKWRNREVAFVVGEKEERGYKVSFPETGEFKIVLDYQIE